MEFQTNYWPYQGRDDSALSLVLIHGWGADSRVWSELIPHLQQHFSITTIDLPGFGVNQHVPVDLTLAELARNVAPYLPDAFICLGWSLGGLLAAELASQFPQRVRALIYIGFNPCFVVSHDNKSGMSRADFDAFYCAVNTSGAGALKRFWALEALGAESSRLDAKWLQNTLTGMVGTNEALIKGLHYLNEVDARSLVEKNTQQALWLWGSNDALVPLSTRQQFARPVFTHHIISGAAHVPFISHRHEVLERIVLFAAHLGVTM